MQSIGSREKENRKSESAALTCDSKIKFFKSLDFEHSSGERHMKKMDGDFSHELSQKEENYNEE